MTLLVPDVGQLSQVMAQSTGPAFILGAVAGFTSILLGRMTSVLDRIRSLNEIADDDTVHCVGVEASSGVSSFTLGSGDGRERGSCTLITTPKRFSR